MCSLLTAEAEVEAETPAQHTLGWLLFYLSPKYRTTWALRHPADFTLTCLFG